MEIIMNDEIFDLTDFDHDDIKLRMQRVGNYLLDMELAQEFGLQPPDGDRQYAEDAEVLLRWANTPDCAF
jgi:hypothetical protein